jgi:hypothetical protein
MSLRRTSNLQIREAVIQRYINEVKRKYFEVSTDNLIRKRKQQDMKLFINLINPDNDNILKTTSFEKLVTRIARSTSVLFTLNDSSMLNMLLTYTFLTRPSILDDRSIPSTIRSQMPETIRSQMPETIRSRMPETQSQQSQRVPWGYENTTTTISSIREPRGEEQITITPGVWIRGTQAPTYTTSPGHMSSITQTPVSSRLAAPITSQIPETPSQQSQHVPWGYEDTTTNPMSSVPPTPLTPEPIFEEDRLPNTKTRSNKNSLIINGTDKLTTCNNEDNDPDPNPNETILSEDNKKWIETNCLSCQDIATQYNYTQEQWSDLVSIKQLDSNGKFTLSQCTSIKYFKKSLESDLIASSDRFNRKNFQTIYSVYKLKNENLQESDLKRGLGTRPTKMLLFKLNLPGAFYIDLESAYKLVHNKTKELYALPLYGGLRRRVGNLKGSLMESSTDHGQIEGHKIYRLLTRSEIENDMEIDFELQLLIESQKLLENAYKDDETNTRIISNVVNYIIDILTGKKGAY